MKSNFIQLPVRLLMVFVLAGLIGAGQTYAQTVNLDIATTPETPVPGEEFNITFSTEEAHGLYFYGVEVDFDSDSFDFVGIDAGSLIDPGLKIADLLNTNTVGASVVRTEGQAGGVGTLMSLIFTVKADAEPGDYTFSIQNPDVRDSSGNSISVNVDGEIIVPVNEPEIGWANLQWPPDATITEGGTADVYAQVYMEGVTDQGGQGDGISAWIGVNSADTDPATWDESAWGVATYNTDQGNNDEYMRAIGADLEPGTYYYASRFQYESQDFVYGGLGGFWNEDSGVLTVEADDPDDPEDTRDVTFSVNMNVQMSEGNYDPSLGDVLYLRGEFNNWETTDPITDEDDGIYTITLEIEGDEGNAVEYKYFIQAGDGRTLPNDGWELLNGDPGLDRSFTLGPAEVDQILDTVFFNNDEGDGEDPDSRDVTFSVDMSVQAALGNYDPALGDIIYVRGDFNDFDLTDPLSLDGDFVYEVTRPVTGDEGNAVEYKFFIEAGDDRSLPNDGWELLNDDPGLNRSFTLGPADVDQDLDTVYFNDEDEAPADPEISFANIQFPTSADITEGETVTVFSQVFIEGVTDAGSSEPAGIQAWIGVSSTDTDPSGWDAGAWEPATFNTRDGNNSEYQATFGSDLPPGTYYYASRFQYLDQDQVYGGTGGFWDGDSGVLTVGEATEFVIVWPGDTNNDGVVNEADVLAIGTYFGQTGPERDDAATNWEGQEAEVWSPVAATYADTDGSGLINQTDLLAVGLNFGETHGDGVLNQSPIVSINLPAINHDEKILVTVKPANTRNIQGLSFAMKLNGLSTNDFSFMQLEPAGWADNWDQNNQLIEFERMQGLNLSGAYVHKGATNTVNASEFIKFEIDANQNWPSGVTLSANRFVIVDGQNNQVPVSNLEIDYQVTTGTSSGGNEELPRQMALHQNYPNPFNPTTNIVFDVSEQSRVTIEIMNILGQRVAVLANQEDFSPGSYTRTFDAGALTSGVYLIRMQAGNQQFTRKMMLIK